MIAKLDSADLKVPRQRKPKRRFTGDTVGNVAISGESRNCGVVELSNSSTVRKLGDSSMASAKREPIMGAWGLCPQWGPGAKPLVRGAKPPWS